MSNGVLVQIRSTGVAICGAVMASTLTLGVTSSTAKLPSTSTVNRAVAKKFRAQYHEHGTAQCQKAGRASWTCKIRTYEDDLALAGVIGGSSDYGGTIGSAQRNFYSFRCTARANGGRVAVGRFSRHYYAAG